MSLKAQPTLEPRMKIRRIPALTDSSGLNPRCVQAVGQFGWYRGLARPNGDWAGFSLFCALFRLRMKGAWNMKRNLVCLVMSRRYIESHWEDVCGHANVVEQRGEEEPDKEALIQDNQENLRQCQAHGLEYILIDKAYTVDLTALEEQLQTEST